MNISHQWLRALVPGLSATPQEVADRLAMLGAPVDEIVDVGGGLGDIVIGRVISAEQHPNADRLRLCTVDAGTDAPLQVVCGAPNVTAGSFYPFAPVGATLPDGMKIRKAKIRGSESQGMLCSARELGLGRDHDGILELHGEFEPGASFVESTGLDDARLVVDITPNRPDLLSHVGIAREIAAAEGLATVLPAFPGADYDGLVSSDSGDGSAASRAAAGSGATGSGATGSGATGSGTTGSGTTGSGATGSGVKQSSELTASSGDVTVRVVDPDLCPHYLAVVIRDVRVGPSPQWLASRLRAAGLRPISNIVDATNYVLHELGHPMHAFDLDRLGTDVVIRRARGGERITTLDGVDRKLDAGMLVIADTDRPVAVAGVMGGADTEVQDDTRNILLEVAVFDPRSVRATRRALGLTSDASYRFERGVDPAGIEAAAARAVQLIRAVAGGSADAAAFAGRHVAEPATIQLRLDRVAQVLGVRFDTGAVSGYLAPLGFTVDGSADDVLRVSVPGHRRFDVAREDDLIEEIARRHGYDAFPDVLRPFRPSSVPTHPLFILEDRIRTLLVGRGMLEVHTAAFAPTTDGDVELMLPLAATESRLRRSLVPGLLRRVEYNFSRGARSIRLFEIGTTFAPGPDGGLPVETTRLAIVCTGHRKPPHWSGGTEPFDVWDMKAIAGDLAAALGLRLEPAGTATERGSATPDLDPTLSFQLVATHDQAVNGHTGRVRDRAVDAPAWADDVWVLEVALPDRGVDRTALRYVDLPQHPGSERDLALIVAADQPAAAVEAAIQEHAGPLLEFVLPFDVYSGSGLPDGVRSIAFRLGFRAQDRTLTDREVDAAVANVLDRLKHDLGVIQRA